MAPHNAGGLGKCLHCQRDLEGELLTVADIRLYQGAFYLTRSTVIICQGCGRAVAKKAETTPLLYDMESIHENLIL